jgi:hypothetical protein
MTGRIGARVAIAAIALVAVGVATYSSSFSGIFVFDDEPSIADNPNIRSSGRSPARWPRRPTRLFQDGRSRA